MSHIVQIKTEVRDRVAVEGACRRLQLAPPVEGNHVLFSGERNGLGVQLPDWRYPVVCELATGQLHYDNFRGRWGEQHRLDSFLQTYAVEKAKLAARRAGYTVSEQTLDNGSIKLTVNVGGAA